MGWGALPSVWGFGFVLALPDLPFRSNSIALSTSPTVVSADNAVDEAPTSLPHASGFACFDRSFKFCVYEVLYEKTYSQELEAPTLFGGEGSA